MEENKAMKFEVHESESDNLKDEKSNKKASFFTEWLLPVILAIIVGFAINRFLIMRIHIPSMSMEKTIMTGDVMYVKRVYHPEKLERGDIVVFYSNVMNQNDKSYDRLIKRLIGLPGDRVDVKDGDVYINGVLLDEPYVNNQEKLTKSFVVPEGKFLFFGDNRAYSNDARKWTDPYIDSSKIIAVAGFRVRPFSKIGLIK